MHQENPTEESIKHLRASLRPPTSPPPEPLDAFPDHGMVNNSSTIASTHRTPETEQVDVSQPQIPIAPASGNTEKQGALLVAKVYTEYEMRRKSAGVAFSLCCMFGFFGAHRFYMGKSGGAVVMLVLTLISVPASFLLIGFAGLFLVLIWVIIDLCNVGSWVQAHNRALLEKLQNDISKWGEAWTAPPAH